MYGQIFRGDICEYICVYMKGAYRDIGPNNGKSIGENNETEHETAAI